MGLGDTIEVKCHFHIKGISSLYILPLFMRYFYGSGMKPTVWCLKSPLDHYNITRRNLTTVAVAYKRL